jgi:excisionase family DNA binding protein
MKKGEEAKMTVKEAAALLGAGESSVRMWCVEGKFPHAEYVQSPRGAYWMIPESDLDGFKKRDRGRPPKAATNGNGGKKGGRK